MYKTDLEALLRDRNIIRIKPQGYSMYPLFIPGRDEALIQEVPVSSLRRNDVILYRRDQRSWFFTGLPGSRPRVCFSWATISQNSKALSGKTRFAESSSPL